MKKKAKKPQPLKKVTRQFLFDLADKIYNPETKQALNLCRGTLSNGPDPVDGKRTMHCGLGELYYAITGRDPDEFQSEDGVVTLTRDQSTFDEEFERRKKETVAKLKKEFKGSPILDELLYAAEDADYDPKGDADEFEFALNAIPRENDKDSVPDSACSLKDYKNRARRVATQFRKAARLLPA